MIVRRMSEDRNQHYADLTCACHGAAAVDAARLPQHRLRMALIMPHLTPAYLGRARAHFAEQPKSCRNIGHGCNRVRLLEGPTLQERRHAEAWPL